MEYKLPQVARILKLGKTFLYYISSTHQLSISSPEIDKLLHQEILPSLEGLNIIPQLQFLCREKHATAEKVHTKKAKTISSLRYLKKVS